LLTAHQVTEAMHVLCRQHMDSAVTWSADDRVKTSMQYYPVL